MVSYWLDGGACRRPPLQGDRTCDIVIVGAGFTGLWTAVELLRRDPALRIVILEADTVGHGASGRNGGFLDPSLTHGLANGLRHFPAEVDELERLAAENYAGFRADLARHQIGCDFEPVGMLEVATRPHEVAELRETADLHLARGDDVTLLDRAGVRERLHGATLLAGLRRPTAGGVLDPGKLVRGLAAAAERLGASLAEHTPVRGLAPAAGGVIARTPYGRVRAAHAILATNAYSRSVLRRTSRRFAPVYDYVLVSEPLTAEQRAAVGWRGREGVSDSGNRFHYFRLTADDRILWGGYDAIYHAGGRVGPQFDQRPSTSRTLQRNFVELFPQLASLRFPYRWGGAIASTTRFTVAFGTGLGGRVGYALGYTGLGVAASRFAAHVLADRVLEPGSPLLQLDFVRRPPLPFPPEPLRSTGINAVRWALARADETGRRGWLLRALDAAGVGFDS